MSHIYPSDELISQAYRWPPEWTGVTSRLRKDFVIFLLIPSPFVALAIIVANTSLIGWAMLLAGLSGIASGVPLYLYSRSDRYLTINGITSSGDRLEIRARRWPKIILHLSHAGLVGASIVAIWYQFAEQAGEYDRWDYQYLFVAFIAAPVTIVWMGSRLLSRLIFRRGKHLGIAISKHGVHHTSWWGEVRFRWHHIEKTVTANASSRTRTNDKRGRNKLMVELLLTQQAKPLYRGGVLSSAVRHWGPIARGHAEINTAALDAYPPVVAQLLRFYFEHPELREELATDKVMTRIRTGNFTT